MATLTITRAEPSGGNILLSGTVPEGIAGVTTYDATVKIADLKALDTPLKRRNAIFAALKAVRDKKLEDEAVDGQLGQIIGATGQV